MYGNAYPFITPSDIDDGSPKAYTARGITEEAKRKYSTKMLPAGAVCYTCIASIGKICITDRAALTNQQINSIVADESLCDHRYLYYLLRVETPRIQAMASGVATPIINKTAFSEIEVELPPLSLQQRIADILSAYDDLIENNTRRIAILEEMARAIYREWFVCFRFPGHEQVEMFESELGPVPAGWAVSSFSDIAHFVNGFAFKPTHFEERGRPIVKIAELKNGITVKTPFNSGKEIPAKFHISNGDVLFSWSADLDAYIWPHGEALLNQHLFNVIPTATYSRLFLFFSLKERMHEFRARSQGTTMRHIKRSALDEVKVVVPPAVLRNAFDELVLPLSSLIINLTSRNQLLRSTRDLLLPRLISGEIEVSAAEEALAEAAA
jgi:type I restriction enzyme S subunit